MITAVGTDGAPVGLAVGSFTSVSLDPPLVAFMPSTTSSSLAYALQAYAASKEIIAQYAAARSAALALAVGAVLARPTWRTRQVIAGLGLTMGLVQVLDAGIGLSQRDLVKTLGPAATGIAGIGFALAAGRARQYA